MNKNNELIVNTDEIHYSKIFEIIKKHENTNEILDFSEIDILLTFAAKDKRFNIFIELLTRCKDNITLNGIYFLKSILGNEKSIPEELNCLIDNIIEEKTIEKNISSNDSNINSITNQAEQDDNAYMYGTEVPTEVIDQGEKIITEAYVSHMSEPYYDTKEVNKLWKIVEKAREENKDNPNYPHIHTLVFKNGQFFVYLKIGEYESWNTPLIDAFLNNKDNELFMNEFKLLFKIIDDNNNITINTVLEAARLKYKDMYGIEVVLENTNNPDIENLSEEDIETKINEEIQKVIDELNLEKSYDPTIQLKNCCLLQKYIVENIEYNEDIMKMKTSFSNKDVRQLDLYNILTQHTGVCSSISILFQEVLRRLDIKVECIGLISKQTGGYHMANAVFLNGKYYFFDSTLESSIYKEYGKGQRLILCCAGLGKKEYCDFYLPKVILPNNPMEQVKTFDLDIAEERIPQELVNSFISKPHKL